MGKLVDLTGRVFTRLTAKYLSRAENCHTWWMCECTCGRRKEVRADSLVNAAIRSCGCLNQEVRTRHGFRFRPEYISYCAAKKRCNNPNDDRWEDYGGRGIKFLFKNMKEFWDELGPRPTKNHTLDRINNDGHYAVGNVRWATKRQQANNRRLPKRKTTCKRGHPYTLDTYITKDGRRDCRVCRRWRNMGVNTKLFREENMITILKAEEQHQHKNGKRKERNQWLVTD